MKRSVRVNAVAPVRSERLDPTMMSDSTVKKFGADTAFGRPAQPVELAPLLVFLTWNEPDS
jgi:NAD(P)-dependent dehydrogenase (short-subunit alcohol dehydrogenase family)